MPQTRDIVADDSCGESVFVAATFLIAAGSPLVEAKVFQVEPLITERHGSCAAQHGRVTAKPCLKAFFGRYLRRQMRRCRHVPAKRDSY